MTRLFYAKKPHCGDFHRRFKLAHASAYYIYYIISPKYSFVNSYSEKMNGEKLKTWYRTKNTASLESKNKNILQKLLYFEKALEKRKTLCYNYQRL